MSNVCDTIDRSEPFSVGSMDDDAQLAISNEPNTDHLVWFKTVVDIDELRFGAPLRSLDRIWMWERAENWQSYLDSYEIPIEAVPKRLLQHASYTAAKKFVEDYICEGLYWNDCEKLTAGFDRFAPAHLPPTEFGRVVGIIRWLDAESGNERAPIVVLPNRHVIDGWHRVVAAHALGWRHLHAYVGCSGFRY